MAITSATVGGSRAITWPQLKTYKMSLITTLINENLAGDCSQIPHDHALTREVSCKTSPHFHMSFKGRVSTVCPFATTLLDIYGGIRSFVRV